jgi:hypothetical protein
MLVFACDEFRKAPPDPDFAVIALATVIPLATVVV